jgi:predicted deacylase
LKIEGIAWKPGTVERGRLPAVELSDGTRVSIPVLTVTGKKPGKTLFLSSVMHGQEITGIEVIRRVCREEVQPRELSGRIIAIPIANPLAFHTSSYHTLRYDYQDLNRSFPGDPKGSITLRLADSIWKVAAESDFVIDLHCLPRAMGNGFSVVRPIGTKGVNRKCFEMAKAFSLPIAVSLPGGPEERSLQPGLQARSVVNGIPALLTEMNDWRRISEPTVIAGVKGVLNVLKRFKMLHGRMEKQKGPRMPGVLLRKTLLANKGGIFHPVAKLGDYVKKGTVIARVLNPYGDEVEVFRAPFDSYVCGFPQLENQALATGDYVASLAVRGRMKDYLLTRVSRT